LLLLSHGCHCGFFSDRKRVCRCRPLQIQKYWSKVSGPLLDRIDLHLNVPAVKTSELINKNYQAESSESIRQRVKKARDIQLERFKESTLFTNAAMTPRDIKKYCQVDSDGEKLLKQAIHQLHISARAYHKILKVSRTISDLEGKPAIEVQHLAEAIQYRSLDRSFWRQPQ